MKNIFSNKIEKLKDLYRPTLGCDPELFFSRNGAIIGSEKVMPEGGIIYRHGVTALNANSVGENKVVMDGIQVELNPISSYCREVLGNNLGACILLLNKRIKEIGDVEADFSPLIEVSQEEMDSLSGQSKIFGCKPTFNAYEKSGIHVDPMEYRFRSAGGHIHLGENGSEILNKILKDDKKLIPLLDIIVGNTCVLIDRDPRNVERRKVYGRAGEYRLPKYGIEYRALSNFWLRSYPLMSFVMGLSRLAVNVLANGKAYYEPILKAVKIDDIRKAINENDFELAYKNFMKIKPLILEMTGFSTDYPINKSNIGLFNYFIKMGIDHFFPKDKIIESWEQVGNGNRGFGWERFLTYIVHADKNKNINTCQPMTSTQ